MHNISPSDIRNGMKVCDVNGKDVGSVKSVEQFGAVGGGYGTAASPGYVHVDTGILGLGKDLYIPFNYFRDCTGDTCYLTVTKNDIDNMGLDKKPSGLS